MNWKNQSAFIIMLLFTAGVAWAESPATLGQGKVSVGVDGGFVFDKDMEIDSAEMIWKDASGAVYSVANTDDIKSITSGVNYKEDSVDAKVGYGVLDNLDIYAKLGMAKGETDNTFNYPGQDLSYILEEDNGFSWALGIKGILHEFLNGVRIGGSAEFGMRKNDVNGYADLNGTRYGLEEFPIVDEWFTDATSATYRAESESTMWELALSISKQFEQFLPYAGLKYAGGKLDVDSTFTGLDGSGTTVGSMEEKYTFKPEDTIGIFVGTDYDVTENLTLNVEGKFVNETAIAFGASYKF